MSAIGLLLVLASMGLALRCVMRLGARRTDEGDLVRRAWSQLHIPAWSALVAAAITVAQEPMLFATSATTSGASLWPVIGPPILASAFALGVALWRGRAVGYGADVWLWPLLTGLIALLALSDRVTFGDGQLLVLGVVSLAWWRSTLIDVKRRQRRGATSNDDPSKLMLYASAAVGVLGAILVGGGPHWTQMLLGGFLLIALALMLVRIPEAALWVTAMTVLGGAGATAIVHSVALALRELTLAQQTTSESELNVLVQVLASSPYVDGFGRAAPEVALALLLSGVVVASQAARIKTPAREALGVSLMAMTLLLLSIRLFLG